MTRLARLRTPLLTALLVSASATVAIADDFWLVPNAFHVATGGEIEVRGQTSSRFPSSRVAVTPDRLAEVRRLDAEGAQTGTGGSALH